MRKIYFVLLVLVLSSTYAIGQNFNYKKYRFYLNKARIEGYNKNYSLEKKYYLKSFKYANKHLPAYDDLESFAICLLNNKDTSEAIKIIENIFTKIDLTLYDSNFLLGKLSYTDSLILRSRFSDYKKSFEEQLDKNQPYWRKIRELELKDQEVRELRKKIPDEEFNKLLKETDSLNHLKLYNLVKNEGVSPFCFLLYHLYDENQKYYNFYDSIIKTQVLNGQCPPESYAMWVDRQKVYVLREASQIYGCYNVPSNEYEFYPIVDIKNVDKRRKEIGLCSLKEYATLNNIKLPKEYLDLTK
ncbi:MAG: hypothetical protein IT215_06275 [Chitinophagaceae bacterium]|nr:hypothetical protein [Chitinophagaceae bacterium]